jgi:uncharacterized protein
LTVARFPSRRSAWCTARRCVLGVLALLALPGAVNALAWDPPREGLQPVPALSARVTDVTGTLSAGERQALEAKLADWEARTTNQLAVLIVPTTKPETIEEYSLRVAEAWKIGQKGKDNGAVFVIAKNDKQMRIEVGYGLEGELTDVAARRVIGDTVAPLFSRGQFAAGIDAGVDRIIAVVGGTDTPPPNKEPRRGRSRGGFDIGTLALILLVAVPALGAILRSILGNVGGSVAGTAIVGGAAWLFAGSLIIAAVAAIIAFVVISFSAFGGRGGPGLWFPGGGGGGGGWGGGGGGFSGGGGGFGGGGASGGWN